MKKIINGKTYNTKTAELVASGSNDLMITDCYYRAEELYRTKKGAYFILDSASNFIIIGENGKFNGDPEYQLYHSFYDWLEFWNVDLDQREIDFFKIVEA